MCIRDSCLTTPYWIWGPEYARIAEQVKAKTYKAGYEYFDADSGSIGLFGFMEGQTPQPGIKDLPAADVQMVKDTCLLYTSDAADDLLCVDLGGRRIIKKKKR